MLDWLRDNLPEGYADAILWVLLALLLFFILLIVARTLRRFRAGTFVLGGRNRRTRLAVMDATPVDSRRRLVLVRRDDVEHLILIGGPTDVVVEQDIRIIPRVARSADVPSPELSHQPAHPPPSRETPRQQSDHAPARRIFEPPRPVTPAVQPAAVTPSPQTRLPPAAMPMSPPPAPPRPKPAPIAQSTPPSPAPNPTPAPPAKAHDDGLLDDLKITIDDLRQPTAAKPTADDEMTRLLGELSQRR